MKFLLLIGGLLGFGIGFIFSWVQESGWPTCLWHGCVALYVTSLLTAWWGRAWRRNLEESLNEQRPRSSAKIPAIPNGKS